MDIDPMPLLENISCEPTTVERTLQKGHVRTAGQ
jgi:hypothetical protein